MTSTAPGGSSGGATDPSSRRLFLLQAVVVALLLTLFGRLYFLQIASGTTAASLASATRNKHVITEAKRGVIIDDMGQKLVDNEAAVEVTLSRTTLDSQKKAVRDDVLNRLGGLLTIAPSDIAKDVEPCVTKGTKNAPINPPPTCNPGSPYQPVAIATYPESGPKAVSQEKILSIEMQIKEHPDQYPGVVVETKAARSYPVGGAIPNTTLAAQTLGHLGPISSIVDPKSAATVAGPYAAEKDLLTTTEVDAHNKVTAAPRMEDVGRGGLEQQYDAELRGLDGDTTLTVDSAGNVDGTAKQTAPVQGDDLVLNVDDKIQLAAENALQTGLQLAREKNQGDPNPASEGAAAVVLTTDGRLVALASTPSFNETAYQSNKTYNQLKNDMTTPLNNRATTGIYPPGSSFKPITSSALLHNGLVGIGQGLPCPQTIQVGNQTFHNFEGAAPASGPLTVMLEESCDTIFAQFADQQWKADGGYRITAAEKKNPDNQYLAKMAKAYGFGDFTHVDIPEASPGIVVDRETRNKVYAANRKSYCAGAKTRPLGSYIQRLDQEACDDKVALYREGEAAQFAIGQGADLEATPLQMARAYAAIANGGTLYAPTLGKALVRPDGSVEKMITPAKTGTVPVSSDQLNYIRQGMYQVTHGQLGTATKVFGTYPVSVCGKTGTAESDIIDDNGNKTGSSDTSWFGSFAPCSADGTEKPKYVVMVVVPRGGQGADVAAPVVKQIDDAIFQISADGKTAARPLGPTAGELPCFKSDGQIVAPNPHCPHPVAPPLAQLQTVVPQTPASSPTGLLATPAAVVPDRRTSAKPKASSSRSVTP